MIGYAMRVGVTFAGSDVMTPVCVVFQQIGLPDEDRLLAILLMIRTAEEEFIERFIAELERMRRTHGAMPIYAANPRVYTENHTIILGAGDDLVPATQRLPVEERMMLPAPGDGGLQGANATVP